MKKAYKTVTEGKFTEAYKLFEGILLTIPLLVVETRKEVDEVKELLTIAKNYLVALKIEIKRKEYKVADPRLVCCACGGCCLA